MSPSSHVGARSHTRTVGDSNGNHALGALLHPCFPCSSAAHHAASLLRRHGLNQEELHEGNKNRHNLHPERANKSHITHSGGHRVCRRREEDDALRREYTKQFGSKYSIALLHNHVLLLLVVVACR